MPPMSRAFAAGVFLAMSGISGHSQILYDAQQGTLPAAQGWSFAALPGNARQTHTGSATRLETGPSLSEAVGYALRPNPPLDRRAGFNLFLRFHLIGAQRTRPERAGFSVIVLDTERRGIELGFSEGDVFAQHDQPLFTRGESADFPFWSGPVEAVLSCRGNRYTLFLNRTPVLSGPWRDYTAFAGFPDVYETPNFLFLGDNTTSAAAVVDLMHVALVRPPRLEPGPAGALSWDAVPGQRYTLERSADLFLWHPLTTVSAPGTRIIWDPPAGGTQGFYRVVHPALEGD